MKIEIFLDKNKKARIRIRANNGRIIMSSEAYSSKRAARDTADMLMKYSPLCIIDFTL